jgi:hypothetical protein
MLIVGAHEGVEFVMADEDQERFDSVVRDYIDFVNEQVGAYMDALAGFAGHHSKVERQVHRVQRKTSQRNENGETVMVWVSYEDPSKPDIIHNRIVRSQDYLAANRPGGSNEQRHARAVVIFLFTYWEDETRPRLGKAKGVAPNEIVSSIMGDLRILRSAILHAKAILKAEEHRRLKVVGDMFPREEEIYLGYEDMHRLFVLIKQDCARLMYEWLGVPNPVAASEGLVDVAIQNAPCK